MGPLKQRTDKNRKKSLKGRKIFIIFEYIKISLYINKYLDSFVINMLVMDAIAGLAVLCFFFSPSPGELYYYGRHVH